MDFLSAVKQAIPSTDRERIFAIATPVMSSIPIYILSLYTENIGSFIKECIMDEMLLSVSQNRFSVSMSVVGALFAMYGYAAQRNFSKIKPSDCLQHSAELFLYDKTAWKYRIKVKNNHPTAIMKITCNESSLRYQSSQVSGGNVFGTGKAELEPGHGTVFDFSALCSPESGNLNIHYKIHVIVSEKDYPIDGETEVIRLYRVTS